MRPMLSIVVLLGLIVMTPQHAAAEVDSLWARTYPIEMSEQGWWSRQGPTVQKTPDGGFIVATPSNADLVVMKTDSRGVTRWTRSYPIDFLTGSVSVCQLRNGGYVVGGGGAFWNSAWGWLMRLDERGNSLGTWDTEGTVNCVQQTADDGFVVVGYVLMPGDGYTGLAPKPYLAKYDGDVSEEWWRWWEGFWIDAGLEHVVELRDGAGYAMVGWDSYEGVYFVKTDLDGVEVVVKSYGGDRGTEILETSDGGFVMCSRWNDQAYLIRTDAVGDSLWTRKYHALSNMLHVGDINNPAVPFIVGTR